MNDYALRLRNVYKTFKKKETGEIIEVLKGVNLDVEKGKIFTILGGSGSGKSVLMRGAVKASEYIYDSGDIELLGENITNYNERQMNEMRLRLSYVFQEGALFNSQKVGRNIGHSIYEHDKDVWIEWIKKNDSGDIKGDKEKRQIERLLRIYDPGNNVYIGGKELYEGKTAEEIFDIILEEKCKYCAKKAQLDYSVVKDKMPSQLSGGMKKRVGLARGLATDPELCILDEPVTGLDPERTRLISEMIREYVKTGTTFVIISHSIPSTKRISGTDGEVGLLYDGRIIFEGLWEEFRATAKGETEKSKEVIKDKETGEDITLEKVITGFCGLEVDIL